MEKTKIAEILDEIGVLLEIKGENPFKARAYHNAARIIANLTGDIQQLANSNSLTSISGIGESIANVITELVQTGKSKNYDELRALFPQELLDLLRLQGLGPKKVKVLYEKLKIKSLQELKKACEEKRLRSLDGFGEKSEENILKSIALLERNINKFLYPVAYESATKIVQWLKQLNFVKQCEFAGSLRRMKELIGDIDILASTDKKYHAKIIESFVKYEDVDTVTSVGSTKASVVLRNGMQCDLRVVTQEEYPFALNYFTGSKEHNVEMRSLAKKFGLSLSEYGFSPINGSNKKVKIPLCKTENDIYISLKLNYIPPELRENYGEIEFAKSKPIPKLIEFSDLRGVFHCHTTYSDGANTIEELVESSRKFGWEYIGIADHSKSAAYAGGMSVEKAKMQIKHIQKLNEQLENFYIFRGIECDILSDGTLDYDNKILSEYDYVIIAIHSKFNMTEREATNRITKALKNKYVTILGHPTGRLLLERDGYPLNITEVINVASDYGKAIEINSHPKRLDLDWRYVKYAKEKGVNIFINPDAHNIEGLLDVKYGIGIARKGWLERKNVVNTWTTKEILSLFSNK